MTAAGTVPATTTQREGATMTDGTTYRVTGSAHGSTFDEDGFASQDDAQAYAAAVIDGDVDGSITITASDDPAPVAVVAAFDHAAWQRSGTVRFVRGFADARQAAADAADAMRKLAAAEAIGREHGTNAAAWWEQDAIGGRMTGDAAAVARSILDGMADGDPAVLDGFPVADLSGEWADGYTVRQLIADVGEDPDDDDPDAYFDAADALADAYRDGFDEAASDAIGAACLAVIRDGDGDR